MVSPFIPPPPRSSQPLLRSLFPPTPETSGMAARPTLTREEKPDLVWGPNSFRNRPTSEVPGMEFRQATGKSEGSGEESGPRAGSGLGDPSSQTPDGLLRAPGTALLAGSGADRAAGVGGTRRGLGGGGKAAARVSPALGRISLPARTARASASCRAVAAAGRRAARRGRPRCSPGCPSRRGLLRASALHLLASQGPLPLRPGSSLSARSPGPIPPPLRGRLVVRRAAAKRWTR